MTENEFAFRSGPFEHKEMQAWIHAIKTKHPDYCNDAASTMIVDSFDFEVLMGETHCRFICCIEGDLPIGMLKYSFAGEGSRIELQHFAVLPSRQRRGIGSALLAKIQEIASGSLPVFASGLLDPAHDRLKSAGFWKVKNRGGGPTYKWSDLPNQQNDWTPEADED